MRLQKPSLALAGATRGAAGLGDVVDHALCLPAPLPPGFQGQGLVAACGVKVFLVGRLRQAGGAWCEELFVYLCVFLLRKTVRENVSSPVWWYG